jgi:sec-independent protein translocase protein TatB
LIDIGISKIALIGVVALIVIGPEKLPSVARTLGRLLGKAQRYIADVKAEVNRTMDLEELKKMKETMESAARDVESSVQTTAGEFEKQWNETTAAALTNDTQHTPWEPPPPVYKHPGKKFRLKQAAVPQWYKSRTGIRTKTLSGAARVARYRPTRLG